MSSTLQAVFREHFGAYADTHRLPLHHHRAAHLIGACRSAALGGHVQGCPEGHVLRVHYNACRHRLCPQCGALARERWLQAECARLLTEHRQLKVRRPRRKRQAGELKVLHIHSG